MIVSIVGESCYIYREAEDPMLRPNRSKSSWSPPGWYGAESRLLYGVQTILNGRGYGLITKRMWRDGHMSGTEHSQYLRSRYLKDVPSLYIHHANAALEVAAESYNILGRVRLDVAYGTGRDDAPDFERACREWVERKEASHGCFQVSLETEATIDGHTARRRIYRGFTHLEQARSFVDSDPDDACRIIDRRTGEQLLAHEIA